MMKKVLTFGAAFLAGATLWAVGLNPASAQYPPEPHSIAVAASELNPAVGGAVSVAAAVTDATGEPLADVECSFTVASQPGSGARVDPQTASTNNDGVATTTLHVGSAAGTIVIEADCDGVSQTLTVTAEDEAAPPASQPELPSAGLVADSSGGGPNLLLIAGIVLMVIAGGSSVAFAARKARR